MTGTLESNPKLKDEYATFEGTAGLRVVQKKPISSSLKAKAVVLGFLLLAIGAFVGQKASQALAAPLELTDVAEGIPAWTVYSSDCPGNDIASHSGTDSVAACQVECEADPSCLGFGRNERTNSCWLKTIAGCGGTIVDHCPATGHCFHSKPAGIPAWTVYSSDCPGNDIASHSEADSVAACLVECEADPSCLGFGRNERTNSCWLKTIAGCGGTIVDHCPATGHCFHSKPAVTPVLMPTAKYCPIDNSISNRDDCQMAFNQIKAASPGIINKRPLQDGNWEGVPYGCSIQMGLLGDAYYEDFSAHWNAKSDTNNGRATTGEFRVICAGASGYQ